jgi:hypothetical protein
MIRVARISHLAEGDYLLGKGVLKEVDFLFSIVVNHSSMLGLFAERLGSLQNDVLSHGKRACRASRRLRAGIFEARRGPAMYTRQGCNLITIAACRMQCVKLS